MACKISCSHGYEYTYYGVLSCDAMWSCGWIPTLQRNVGNHREDLDNTFYPNFANYPQDTTAS
jgi:hypothetical protein